MPTVAHFVLIVFGLLLLVGAARQLLLLVLEHGYRRGFITGYYERDRATGAPS